MGKQKILSGGEEGQLTQGIYRHLFETSPYGIIIADGKGAIVDVNPQIERLLGLSLEEIKGKRIWNLSGLKCLFSSREGFGRLLKEGPALRDVLPLTLDSGKRITAEVIGTVHTANGKQLIQCNIRKIHPCRENTVRVNHRCRKARNNIQDPKEMDKERTIAELHRTAVRLTDAESEREVCRITVEAAEELLHFNICNIGLREGDMLVVKAASSDLHPGEWRDMPITEGIAGKTYRTGKSYIIDNIHQMDEARPASALYRSVMSLPLGELGVFQAASCRVGAFSQEDLYLAEILIAHTTGMLRKIMSQKELKYLSFRDALTGLYNRAFLEEELNRLDRKRKLPLSIIMADVNGLKLVNDTFGHAQGDELLKKTADILQLSCRGEDIIARWGGDEFVIILPHTTQKEAELVSNRIREKCINQEDSVPVSIAIGCAVKDDPQQEMEDIIKRAEEMMYKTKLTESRSAKGAVLKALLNSLGTKSHETEAHAMRLQRMALALGEEINLPPSELDRLSLLVSLHDIGKTSISEEILMKEGELTENEWEIMKKHSERGYRIASATEEFAHVARDILHHHENWDGSGYPEGLKGEDIPILSRITAIVDAYDAMTNSRPYSSSLSQGEAVRRLKYEAGRQFDPELIEIFVRLIKEKKIRAFG